MILSVAHRLLFLDSNVFYVDGDEAIVGLMGIDILEGELPLYFYGQTYAFSFIEAILISVGIILFGTSALAIKLMMIVFWGMSLSLFVITIYNLTNRNLALSLLLMLVIITSPTWLVWSMKARGGYLTSLFLSNLVLYLLLCSRKTRKYWFWGIMGVLLAFVFESQPLWFPVTFTGYVLALTFQASNIKIKLTNLSLSLISAVLILLILSIYKQDLYVVWHPPSISFSHVISNPLRFITSFNSYMNGLYYLYNNFDIQLSFHGFLTWILLILAVTFSLKNLLSKNYKSASWILLIPASITGFFLSPDARYLMPFTFILFLSLVLILTKTFIKRKRIYYSFLTILILANILYTPNFYGYSQMKISNFTELSNNSTTTDNQIILDLISTLSKRGIEFVISKNYFLEYQINYFSGYNMLSLSTQSKTRQLKNIESIQKAYLSTPEKFAFVGYNWDNRFKQRLPIIGGKLYYWVNPPWIVLKELDYLPVPAQELLKTLQE